MTLADITAKVGAMSGTNEPLGSTVKFDFGDGILYLDGNNGNAISNEDKDADCTVKVTMEDFSDMLSGNLAPMTAFMSGKMKIDGDMGVAMKLSSLFG